MGIRSRFIQGDVRSRYILPVSIHAMFDKAPAFGSVYDRPTFMGSILKAAETNTAEYDGLRFSVRPSWMQYHPFPRTHVIITGHVLICHIYPDREFFQQPTVHLFDEEAQYRLDQMHELIGKARKLG